MVDATGYVYYILLLYYAATAASVAILFVCTYRRGVCVARFYDLGNAKASKGETSNRYRFSRFSFYIGIHIAESGELIGTDDKINLLSTHKFYTV